MKSLIFSALLACAAFSVNPAAAESNRLSQIDFDEPETAQASAVITTEAKTPVASPAMVDPELLLSQGLVKTPQEQVQAAPPAPAAPPTVISLKTAPADARGRLVAKPISFDGLQNPYITPRLKGPFVDKGKQNSITTTATWSRGTSSSGCGDVNHPEAVCSKAKALKELLFKFSGSDDFFDTQCAQDCSNGHVAVPTGLAVSSVKGGNFKMVADALQCRYEIHKDPRGRWLALQASKITCSCLPTSCVK